MRTQGERARSYASLQRFSINTWVSIDVSSNYRYHHNVLARLLIASFQKRCCQSCWILFRLILHTYISFRHERMPIHFKSNVLRPLPRNSPSSQISQRGIYTTAFATSLLRISSCEDTLSARLFRTTKMLYSDVIAATLKRRHVFVTQLPNLKKTSQHIFVDVMKLVSWLMEENLNISFNETMIFPKCTMLSFVC